MDMTAVIPDIRIDVKGGPLSGRYLENLAELAVRQEVSLPSQFILSFIDADGSLGERNAIGPGDALRIFIDDRLLFSGEVTGITGHYRASGEPRLEVRGYDLLHRLRKAHPVRAHVQMSVAELARELVSGLGLAVKAVEDGPVLSIMQHRQTDFEVLVEVAERAGLHFFLRRDEIVLFSLRGASEPALDLRLGETLLEAHVDLNADPICRSVTISGWDPGRAVTHGGTASTPRVPHGGADLIGNGAFGGLGELHITDRVAGSDVEAEVLAQSVLDRRSAAVATLRGIAEGRADLNPGAVISVSGLPAHLAHRHVVTSALHRIDGRSGYTVTIDTSPPAPQARPRDAAMTLGRVSRVDDPDELGRVRATLPSLDNLETDWLQVLIPGAGPGKGLIVLPDIGDQVLVLFPAGDPGQGVVLGGLYGREQPPDAGIDQGRTSRFTFRTAAGQSIRLDQGEDAIRIENGRGLHLDMRGSEIRLHAGDRLIIEAPGGSLTFRARKIDFERG